MYDDHKSSIGLLAPELLSDKQLDEIISKHEAHPEAYPSWVIDLTMEERERRKTAERHGKIE